MFKVTNQSRYRPRVGRVIGPALGGAAGSSSSRKRRKTGARVPAKKNQRSSFCLPHLDQGYLREANLLARRYKIRELRPLDPNKKLLVLDLDKTLIHTCDKSLVESLRPYIHLFLQRANKEFNLVIWSASDMTRIKSTVKRLGLSKHKDFKFCFYLCAKALLLNLSCGSRRTYFTKPLQVLWKNCDGFSDKNTVMIDDLPSNFLLNPQSGLIIKPYSDCNTTKSADEELRLLSKYLKKIANLDDFRKLNHSHWHLHV